MVKKAAIHIHMEYSSAIKKKAFESVLMRWMKVEPILFFFTDKYDPVAIYFIVLGSNLYTVFVFPV